ncbi:gas vesicle protein GvpL [Salinilacihabitans rarus]|uniref:gas vesicle protein GvpL n=1 Tax=Salinilacihabitans rarus TaxID=2961596 RepID=UPI0020C87F3F|nr:GvpL/GvpF family gas vesicle protein [Salinilacihabitans rarus]
MTDDVGRAVENGGPETAEDAAEEPPEFDEGRYVYCVVRAEADDADAFEGVTGLEDEPVSLVAVDGVGAVVHACEGLYDSADLGEIRRWLVRHQSVVDAAAERFGTPLPFQFDTIVRGDDGTVREWLREERETLADVLGSLAGHWEYRIEVVRTDPVDAAALEADDERLAGLRERIDDAAEGTAFLLEKRYDRRAAELRRDRREALAADLRERLAGPAREVHELDRSPAATLDEADGSDEAGETVCRLTVLAREDREDAVGSVLDDVAAEPGIEVRFTGPWPPYTFVPDLGDETDAGSAGGRG